MVFKSSNSVLQFLIQLLKITLLVKRFLNLCCNRLLRGIKVI